MSIRTAEQLSDKLSCDLAWRKKELTEIKSLVEMKSSHQRHIVLVRSGICILYSHWEGFVKLAASSYLEYVRSQRLNYQDLSSNFLALAMKFKLNQAKETNKPSLYIPVCEFFLSDLNQRCSLPDVISTASNLSSSILQEITTILGIDFEPYSRKSKLIDERLLKARNEIAHGEYYPLVDSEDYIELHIEIIHMLNLFRNQIENASIEKKYLKHPNLRPIPVNEIL